MRRIAFASVVVLGLAPVGCAPKEEPPPPGPPATIVLRSASFGPGKDIPEQHTCIGADRSPELNWDAVPPGTASFALTLEDRDSPGGNFTHWVLFDIPGTQRQLPSGVSPGEVGVAGANGFGRAGYGGPCPPPTDREHRYVFTLHALDVPTLGLPPGASRADVERAMEGHVLAVGRLTGLFER